MKVLSHRIQIASGRRSFSKTIYANKYISTKIIIQNALFCLQILTQMLQKRVSSKVKDRQIADTKGGRQSACYCNERRGLKTRGVVHRQSVLPDIHYQYPVFSWIFFVKLDDGRSNVPLGESLQINTEEEMTSFSNRRFLTFFLRIAIISWILSLPSTLLILQFGILISRQLLLQ